MSKTTNKVFSRNARGLSSGKVLSLISRAASSASNGTGLAFDITCNPSKHRRAAVGADALARHEGRTRAS
jgi:hypothetical protein